MSERNHVPPHEIIVATAHDLFMTPEGGQPHTLEAPRNDANELDIQRVLRASERRIEVGVAHIELEDGQERALPVFEVAYTGLENPSHMHRLMANVALNQVVVGSRLGGRYLYHVNEFIGHVDIWDKFGHPANIIRDPDTGGIISAERIGVPQRTMYAGPQLSRLDRAPIFEGTSRLVNYLPEDMYLQSGDEILHVANCGYVADVNYHYEQMGQTAEGIVISHSTPQEVVGMPEKPARNELRLVHTEVLFESLRLGVATPEEASRMVIACGLGRMPSGQQGNTFTGLAYYDVDTLRHIYEAIRV
jgi:hypothetical protein